jgi:hypothetical protein
VSLRRIKTALLYNVVVQSRLSQVHPHYNIHRVPRPETLVLATLPCHSAVGAAVRGPRSAVLVRGVICIACTSSTLPMHPSLLVSENEDSPCHTHRLDPQGAAADATAAPASRSRRKHEQHMACALRAAAPPSSAKFRVTPLAWVCARHTLISFSTWQVTHGYWPPRASTLTDSKGLCISGFGWRRLWVSGAVCASCRSCSWSHSVRLPTCVSNPSLECRQTDRRINRRRLAATHAIAGASQRAAGAPAPHAPSG